jgi:hypothetical protein
MSTYDVILFIHLSALAAAFGADGVIVLVRRRLLAARTGGEALQWLAIAKAAARAYPVALLLLVASGSYMVHDAWSWSAGWIDAGLAGAVALAVLGGGIEGRAAGRIAKGLAARPQEAPGALVRDRVFWTVGLGNPALALGIVFVMATKPSAPGAIASLLVAYALGAAAAVPFWRSPQVAPGLAAGAEQH